MATFEYSVDGQSITTTKAGRLVSGTIGVNSVKFTFDSSWDGLEKWATFDPNPGKPYKQPLDANGECLIPGEVMGGITLRIGAFGLADGQAYPTVWANKLQMEEGCFIEVPVSDWPEPSPVIEEILEELENKVDKPEDATPGNVAIIGSNQNIVDSGVSLFDILPSKSASGAVATFSDGVDNLPIKSMSVDIQPVQAGSGDPSPSNVRAISGWTKAMVYTTGKNLWNPHLYAGLAYNMSIGSVRTISDSPKQLTKVSDGVYTISTTSTWQYYAFIVPIKYVHYWMKVSFSSTGTFGTSRGYMDKDFKILSCTNNTSASQSYNEGRAPGGTEAYYYIVITNRSTASVTITITEPQFEVGTSASTYTPYVGNTYEIEFPSEAGTVYGGELTVAEDGTGTLTVDRKGVTLNGSEDEDWTMYASGKFFVPCTSGATDAVDTRSYYISNKYLFAGTGDSKSSVVTVDQRFYGQLSYGRIWVYDSTYTTLEAWKAELSTNPLTCVYPLATPVVYQLTAEQVQTLLFSTLKGINNVWADTGDISIDYHADPTIFVEEKTKAIKQSIAPVEDGYTASQAYAVGSFLYVGDTLYKVTSAIASGATITPNTNVVATTVAEQLMALA